MGKEKKIDYQQFLTLAQQMLAEQYGEENDKIFQEILEQAAEPEPRRIDPHSSLDLTRTKSDQLTENISKTSNILVGRFVLKITRKELENMQISLYEQGSDHIHRRIQENDLRFRDAPRFGGPLSLASIVSLVRHLQIVSSLPLFL